MKQGDLLPALTATLTDSSGYAVDINGANVRLLLVDAFTRVVYLSGEASNDQQADGSDGSLGTVHYDWQPGDTDVPSVYRGEWEVTFVDSEIGSFPNDGVVEVAILPKSGVEEAS